MEMEERETHVYSVWSKLGSILHIVLVITLYIMAYQILGRWGLLFMAIFMSATYGIRLLLKRLWNSFWFIEYGEVFMYFVVVIILSIVIYIR